MPATLVRSAMLKITADDGDTEAKLSLIKSKADELARLHPDLTVKINTAAASAKLGVLRAELKDTSRQAADSKVQFGSLGQALNDLTVGLPSGVGEMSMFGKVMAAVNIATGIAEPLMAGVVVAAGGLAAGFLSAGAGAGIFAKVATGAWGLVSANIKAAATATEQINAASTPKQLTAGVNAFEAALKGLSGPQRQLAVAGSEAEVTWHSFLVSSTAGVNSVLVPALGLVPKALSAITPFLAPVEHALSGVVSMVSSGLNSGGLKSFISSLASNAGPAITKISVAIKNVIVGIGGILKAFMPVSQGMMGGLDKITGDFARWGQTLTGHSGFKDLMNMFKTETPLAITAIKNLLGILKTVGGQMTGMDTFGNSKMFLQMAVAVTSFVNSLLKAHPELVWLVLYLKLGSSGLGKLKTAFSGLSGGVTGIKSAAGAMGDLKKGITGATLAEGEAASGWQAFGGKISGIGTGIKSAVTAVKEWGIWSKIAGAATKVWTGIQAAFDVVMDANPIVLIVIAIGLLVAAIVVLVIKFKPVRDFFKAAWKDIENAFVDAWHFIDNDMIHPFMNAVGDLVTWVKSHFALLATIIATVLFGPIGLLVAFVITHWNQIKTETGKLVDGVVSFFKSLPGKIMGAIAALPGLLFSAGANIIHMLANGIKSAIGDVTGAIGHIASEITSHLPFSPAKKGPLSGRGDPRLAGQRIAAYVAGGMTSQTGLIESAAAGVARAAMVGGGGQGGGAGHAVNVQIGGGSGDQLLDLLIRQLRNNIRVTTGGDIQRWATGR